jgi:hypothetical protein
MNMILEKKEGVEMKLEMQKAILLAENINDFIKFIKKIYENKTSLGLKKDKWYQIKLLIEEFKFQMIADELKRINMFEWDKKYTHYLVESFMKGLNIIDEYVRNNGQDLFLISGRLHTLRTLCFLIMGEKDNIISPH